jgi:acetyltransferase-like isoleucine patch superfamily enzyme
MIFGFLKTLLLNRLGVRGQNVKLGKNAHIGPFSRVWAPYNLEIGRDFYCGRNVTIECDGSIGDSVLIANNVGVIGRRDHDHLELGVSIRHSRWVGNSTHLSSRVSIGNDVWIGFGAILLSPISIGNHSIIAAGSVVRENVPEFAIIAGNPGQVVGWRFASIEDRLAHARTLAEK